jgi:hypothetical protein
MKGITTEGTESTEKKDREKTEGRVESRRFTPTGNPLPSVLRTVFSSAFLLCALCVSVVIPSYFFSGISSAQISRSLPRRYISPWATTGEAQLG